MERGMGWSRCRGGCSSSSSSSSFPIPLLNYKPKTKPSNINIPFATPPRFSLPKRCRKCGGKGAIDCPGCKGSGKNKKNGNIFERWKCFECQGFGLKSCPECGNGGGLTPEQRGER